MPSNSQLNVVAEGDETTLQCKCCGRPLYAASGRIEYDHSPVADYWYWWSLGHESRFKVAVRFGSEGEERMVFAEAQVVDGDIQFGLVDPDATDTAALSTVGRILNREQALADPWHPDFWDFFDAVVSLDKRLLNHVSLKSVRA